MRSSGLQLLMRVISVTVVLVCVTAQRGSCAPSRQVMLDRMAAGEAAQVLADVDSLALLFPEDARVAYVAARAGDLAGRVEEARCRYAHFEARFPSSEAAPLATYRRLALERQAADALMALGPDGTGEPGAVAAGNRVLILPLENVGGVGEGLDFGWTWTYLVHEALRGSDLCLVALPRALATLDLLRTGTVVRASPLVATHPVNTVEGLRGRLATLPAASGEPYLYTGPGAWTEDLEDALLRFQKEQGLPPTGEADPATQNRLDAEMERWLLSSPPSLDPKLIPRVAQLTDAGHVVRGTYRLESGQVTVLITVLDPSGLAVLDQPLAQTFPLRETSAAASRVAALLAARLGGRFTSVPVCPLAPPEVSLAATTLLLVDRGMPLLAKVRWERAPQHWSRWTLLQRYRAGVELSAIQVDALEHRIMKAFALAATLDAEDSLAGFLRTHGRLPGSPDGTGAEEGPLEVGGRSGILRIRGERP